MKSFFYLLVACLFMMTGTTWAQENNSKEETRVERKAAKQKAKDFVLEADRVEFKRGQFVYVTPNTNFVSFIDGRATIQLTFNVPASGPNGIGGITVEGQPSNIKMETNKKGDVTFSMMVQGTGVSASISIRVPKGTAKCTATVNPTFNSNRLSFTGILYPAKESRVFKGRSL